jgi:hypothetical protein
MDESTLTRSILPERQTHFFASWTANSVKRGEIWRMASCLAWSRLLICGAVVRSTKERPLDPTSPPTLAAQGEQEADEHQAGDF